MRNLKTILSRSCRLLMLAGSVMTAPVSSFGQNHNPDFGVSSTFLGGEPYILVGEDDNEVYPNRTPVELKYREEAPEGGRTGMTTLEWSSGGDKVDSYDSSSDEDGVVDGTASASPAGPWTWTDDAEQQDYDGKTIHLQGKAAAASGDTATLKASHDEDTGNPFEKTFTLLKVEFEGYESLEDFNPVANAISNDVQTAPEETPEKERTVEVVFTPSDFFQNYSDRITFEISSLTPDTSPNKGSIDDTAFKDSGGVEPVHYVSKFEAANTYMWNDPAIQAQRIYIRVLFDGDGIFDTAQPVDPPYPYIRVFSRFNYLWGPYPAPSEEEKFSMTIQHVIWKYNLSFSFTPEYSTDYDGGATIANGFDPDIGPPFATSWEGVYLGPGGMASEQFAANTLVHENSHYEDGMGYALRSGIGDEQYHEWVDGGRTSTLSDEKVVNIFAWIEGEKESILDQQAHPTYDYMHPGETGDVLTYWNDMVAADNDMTSHGYSL